MHLTKKKVLFGVLSSFMHSAERMSLFAEKIELYVGDNCRISKEKVSKQSKVKINFQRKAIC